MMPKPVQGEDQAAAPAQRDLPPAAQRALKEAEARRAGKVKAQSDPVKEFGGPAGSEPVRYGDWELKGRAIDF